MGLRPIDDSELKGRGKGKQTSSRKKKKKKWILKEPARTFLKVFGTTVGVFVVLIGLIIFCSMAGWLGDVGEINLQDLTIGTSSEIYYEDPETGEEIYMATITDGANRKWVDFEDIPKDMVDAFVSIEDERFYKHSGFDILRTTKATAMYFVGKLTGKGSDFGGSTITQQLIKNATGDWDNTPSRKIKEISQAVNLEKKLTKDEVLELYLNIINLSNGCYGVQSASMEFFGKPVDELNLAECACIAGITQNPSKYDPLRNPNNNKAKQEIVLKKMLDLGYIEEDEYKEAVDYKLTFRKTNYGSANIKVNDYYVEAITKAITNEFMDMGYSYELAVRKATSGGLKIMTTIDPVVQNAIDEVYANPETCASVFGWKADTENTPQSAIVVLTPKGAISGLYGGLGPKSANLILDRTTVPRQPGSSIKPIAVYSPAIEEEIIHASTSYSDEPEDFNGWSPRNSYSDGGDKTVQVAVQRSSNIIACRVLRDLGVETSYNHLKHNLGVTSLYDSDKNLPALGLGGMTKGISPLEMTAAYTPFVNGGIYTEPYIYTKVYDRTGEVVLESNPHSNRALSPQTAYIMTQLLRRVVTSGTGGQANLSTGVFAAGKTGTTDDNKDKWFMGFTPNYVCGIWHGYDKNSVVASNTSGSQIAFRMVMDKVHSQKKARSISVPEGITMLSVCKDTGLLASEACEGITLPFTEKNVPDEYCEHISEEAVLGEDGEVVDIDTSEDIVIEPAA